MRRILTTGIIVVLMVSMLAFAAPPSLTSKGAILIEANSKTVLVDHNMHTKLYPASTTKVLTALIILENHALDEVVTIDSESPFTPGSRIYIEPGEQLTIEQLLYALLVESANDVASALAIYHSGSIEAFSLAMNERASQLGTLNSHFTNPHGLHEDQHVSTAYDLAIITIEAMKNDTFRKMVVTTSYTIPANPLKKKRDYLRNSNWFLPGATSKTMDYKGKTIPIAYDRIEGVKTGYTDEAGSCLISSVSEGDLRFITVVLSADGRNLYTESRALLDFGLEDHQSVRIVTSGQRITNIKLPSANQTGLDLLAQDTLTHVIKLSDEEVPSFEENIQINDNIVAPVQKGDVLGQVTYTYLGQDMGQTKLVAARDISANDLLGTATSVLSTKWGFESPWELVSLVLKLLLAFWLWRSILRSRYRRKLKKQRDQKRAEILKQNTQH